MKHKAIALLSLVTTMAACNNGPLKDVVQGKVEREEIAVVGKIAGRVQEIRFSEGDFVKKGDTLAVLDIPELRAKKTQAGGAARSAEAQYRMSKKGATDNQMKQLQSKRKALEEQYEFARISKDRLAGMVADSLIPQQQYDEVYAKFKGAEAQLEAVDAEIAEVSNGARPEQQQMALGQQERAWGAVSEVEVAEEEQYIIAPQDMILNAITLKVGELALPGYTLFKGNLDNSAYFRFTVPESRLRNYKKGQEVTVSAVYNDQVFSGTIQHIRQLGSYADIASAYPDYKMQDVLYEIIVRPSDQVETEDLIDRSTVILN